YLTSEPTTRVTVDLATSDPTEGVVNEQVLFFDQNNWNDPQEVDVAGEDDDVADGPILYYFIAGASAFNRDPAYQLGISASVPVTNFDDDTAGLVVSRTSGLVTTEAGGRDTFSVVLTSEPTADVTVNLSSSNAGEVTLDVTSVTFDAADWNVPQTVTVRGVDDALADGDVSYTVVTAPAESNDPLYRGMDAD